MGEKTPWALAGDRAVEPLPGEEKPSLGHGPPLLSPEVEVAPLLLGQPARDEEPEPHAALLSGHGHIRLDEREEQIGAGLEVTMVHDLDDPFVALAAGAEPHGATPMPERVAEELLDDPGQVLRA